MLWSILVLALALSPDVGEMAGQVPIAPTSQPAQINPVTWRSVRDLPLPPSPEIRPEVRTATCLLRQAGRGGSALWEASGEFRLTINAKGEPVTWDFTPKINSGTVSETTHYNLPGFTRVTLEEKITWESHPERRQYSTISGSLPDEKPFTGVVGSCRYQLDVTTETRVSVRVANLDVPVYSEAVTDSRMFTIELTHTAASDWCRAAVYGFFEEDWFAVMASEVIDVLTLGLVRIDPRPAESLKEGGLWLPLPPGKTAMSRRGSLMGDNVNYDLRWSKE